MTEHSASSRIQKLRTPRAAAAAGGAVVAICRDAVSRGLMVEHAAREISGGDPIFTVTDAGKAFVTARSPKPPKVSRGKERYLRWLTVNDITGWTFGEWLKKGCP